MRDARDLLRAAAPDPRDLDLAAVAGRAGRLRNRRRAALGAAGATALVAVGSLATAVPGRDAVLAPAAPSSAPTPGPALPGRCDGPGGVLDRDYQAADADTAVRDEAPGLLGIPGWRLAYERTGPAPSDGRVTYRALDGGRLIGVLVVVDRPGRSGVEQYTICGPQDDEPALPSDGLAGQTVTVYFTTGTGSATCTEVTAFQRQVEPTDAVATAALSELFAGPNPDEQREGAGSLFGPGTADLLRSVRVAEGVAYVDLEDITGINNLSTTCMASSFLAQTDATLTQFPSITEVVYAIEGDPARFYDFLGLVCPAPLLSPNGDCDPSRFSG